MPIGRDASAVDDDRADPGDALSSTPELLVDALERRGRPLEIVELVLAPAPGQATQPASLHNDRFGVEPFSNRTVSLVFDGANYNRCFAEIDTDDFWQLESSSVERNAWSATAMAKATE